ncbi:Uncharacterized protein dnm_049950 [Desulfonema magnum]|uniref:Uncharacterized protein n=1 Tax=Desulfonema magnum TaxID=45655 RepID=A0A975GQH3_9BACT|nr:Uncharacterized protein dnm_049950 [Desulfonema magnum]
MGSDKMSVGGKYQKIKNFPKIKFPASSSHNEKIRATSASSSRK